VIIYLYYHFLISIYISNWWKDIFDQIYLDTFKNFYSEEKTREEIYKSNNSFFITICVSDRREIFEMCLNGEMIILNNGDTVVASTEI